MAMFLKPIPKRSDFPFDPDNPVPKGRQLLPEELRAKYYKVINSDAKYYVGDPRMQRARHHERDPRRTKHFKKQRADMQEVFDDTRRYVIDEICRGRWYKRENGEEATPAPDLAAIAAKAAARPGVENDMFSILSNRYGREFKGRRGPPKTDFIGKNIKTVKLGRSQTMSKSLGSTVPTYRGTRPGMFTEPTKEEMEFMCSKFVDKSAVPQLMQWLDKAPSSDRNALVKAFQAMDHGAPKRPTKHQQALAAAQEYRKLTDAGVPPHMIKQEQEAAAMRQSLPTPDMSFSNSHGGLTQSVTFHDTVEAVPHDAPIPANQHPQQQQQLHAQIQPQPQSKRPRSSDPSHMTRGGERPSTAFINTLPMPPAPGEIPPPNRRNEGMYPTHWKPSARVMELKEKLQQILSTKHRHLKISFRRFDEDHKGTIDLAELYRVAVEESGIQCTRKELEELWDLFDRDRDGIIKYADYAKTMGNDALDERDYFQIAQRKAAGRYNEAVAFYKNEEEQEAEHFLNKKHEGDLEKHLEKMSDLTYEKAEDPRGHSNLFTLPEKKFGALFNETHLRSANTVKGTNAHKLRLELTEALKKHFGTPANAFAQYSKGLDFVSEHTLKKMIRDVGVKPKELTVNEMVSAFDRDRDGNLQIEEWVRLFSDTPVVHGPERYTDPNPLGSVNPDLLYNTDKPRTYQDLMMPIGAEYTQTAWAVKGESKSVRDKARLDHRQPPKPETPEREPLFLGTTVEQKTFTQLHRQKLAQGPPKKSAAQPQGASGRRSADALLAAGDTRATGGEGASVMLPPRPSTALSATGGFNVSQAARGNAGMGASLQERASTPLTFIRERAEAAKAEATRGGSSGGLGKGKGGGEPQAPWQQHRVPHGAEFMPRPASTPPTMMEPRGGVEGERAASNNRAVTPASASGAFGRPREGWSMSREPSQGFRAQRPTTASGLVPTQPQRMPSPVPGAAWGEDTVPVRFEESSMGGERRMRPLSAAGWEMGGSGSRTAGSR